MASLKNIKNKIRSIQKTRKVTEAMEAVSAAKMRKAQHRAIAGRAYARAAASILARVSGSRTLAEHPLVEKRKVRRALYIVITSDKGLAGALNSAVLRGAYADMRSLHLDTQAVSIVAVGRKAQEFFSRREFLVEHFYPNTDALTSELIQTVVNDSIADFTAGTCDVVRVVYQNLISTFEQRPTIRTVLPLSLEELERVVTDIVPVRGQFAELRRGEHRPSVYTVEPSEEEVLAAVMPKLASIFIYHALLESQASEHSARMVAMKNASDKGEELEHLFTLRFNKARQAMITREVSEITGGMVPQ